MVILGVDAIMSFRTTAGVQRWRFGTTARRCITMKTEGGGGETGTEVENIVEEYV
jgi:hypothetical protein